MEATKLERYSLRNQLLIVTQYPEATECAGFRAWAAMGRQVRKDEKGIAILAPTTKKVTDDKGNTETVTRFRNVYVFDITQTDPIRVEVSA